MQGETNEIDSQLLKDRAKPHGTGNGEEDNVRKYFYASHFVLIRFLLAITTFRGMRLTMALISGAYL